VRQLFIWGLSTGIGGAAGAKSVRIALYNSWNKLSANKKQKNGRGARDARATSPAAHSFPH
jgi:hypothetical protein